MWFDSWSDIVRILAVGAAAYLALVVLLRVSGKRTLAKLNAFDWVVSVAFGSTLATILLSSDVSWSEGVVALALLAALQFVLARTTTWFPGGRSVVTARPTLLLEDGRPIPEALDRQRITMSELRQAIRAHRLRRPVLGGRRRPGDRRIHERHLHPTGREPVGTRRRHRSH